jgi:hypothetical protein
LLDAGAAHVIAADDQDLVKEILKITNGKGGRIIFDPVGGPTIAKLTQAMAGFETHFIYGALDEIQFIYGALDEIQRAHFAVGGTSRGRRFATQQINRAYAVLLASQFQGFCRDLHSECIDHLMTALAPTVSIGAIIRSELTRARKLDMGNAQPGSLGEDWRVTCDRFATSFDELLRVHLEGLTGTSPWSKEEQD